MYPTRDIDWIDVPSEVVDPKNRKWGWWGMPTTLDKDDLFDISTPDYVGWDLGKSGNAHYDHLVNYGGGGFMRGVQAAMEVENPTPSKLWNALRDQQKIAAQSRQELGQVGVGGFPKAVGKQMLNQYLEGIDMAVNTWHPNNWDSFDDVAQAVTQKTGNPANGKTAKTALNATGKVLMTAAPLMDVVDFGLRVSEGQNVVRAGAGTVGGVGGAMAGATIGAALTGPFAPVGAVIGAFAGSYLGDTGATKAYELVTEDAWEKTRKLQEQGLNVSLDQVKNLESQGYSVDAGSGQISRAGQVANLSQVLGQERKNEVTNWAGNIPQRRPAYQSPDTTQQDMDIARNIMGRIQSNNQQAQLSSQDYIEESNRRFNDAIKRIKESQSSYNFLETPSLF